MKCRVCGRGMVVEKNRFECPNILCDYEEEIGDNEMIRDLIAKMIGANLDETVTSLS